MRSRLNWQAQSYIVLIRDEKGKELSRKPGLTGGSAVLGISIEPEMTFPETMNLSLQYDLSIPGKYGHKYS